MEYTVEARKHAKEVAMSLVESIVDVTNSGQDAGGTQELYVNVEQFLNSAVVCFPQDGFFDHKLLEVQDSLTQNAMELKRQTVRTIRTAIVSEIVVSLPQYASFKAAMLEISAFTEQDVDRKQVEACCGHMLDSLSTLLPSTRGGLDIEIRPLISACGDLQEAFAHVPHRADFKERVRLIKANFDLVEPITPLVEVLDDDMTHVVVELELLLQRCDVVIKLPTTVYKPEGGGEKCSVDFVRSTARNHRSY